MKSPKPYFREFDGWWYVQIRTGTKRHQVKLAKGKENREAAETRWHEIMASKKEYQPAPLVAADSVKALLDLFLANCHSELSKATADWYEHFLKSFAESVEDLSIQSLERKYVTKWLNEKNWSKSTKAGAIQSLRTAMKWLSEEGHIRGNPLRGLRGTRKASRETMVSDDDFKKLIEATDGDFGMLLTFLRQTGARPQEARLAEVRHVDLPLRRIVFPASESKGKEHPRVIYLDDQAFEIVKAQCERFKTGRLFRSRGRAWTRNAIRCRFRRLRTKVGRFCAYNFRHTFATEALKKLDPISVSVLMGHSDPTTLARVYQHLGNDPKHMLATAKKATGGA